MRVCVACARTFIRFFFFFFRRYFNQWYYTKGRTKMRVEIYDASLETGFRALKSRCLPPPPLPLQPPIK